MKTRKELWQLAYDHVVKQGVPAMVGTSCKYHDNVTGNGCAVGGPMFNEGIYDPEMEGATVPDSRVRLSSNEAALVACLDKFGVDHADYLFLHEIQECHDDAAHAVLNGMPDFIGLFCKRMEVLRIRYEL